MESAHDVCVAGRVDRQVIDVRGEVVLRQVTMVDGQAAHDLREPADMAVAQVADEAVVVVIPS